MAQKQQLGPAPVERGDRVRITEDGLKSWVGTVRSVKPSFASGWWADVEREDGVWAINLASTDVEVLTEEDDQ